MEKDFFIKRKKNNITSPDESEANRKNSRSINSFGMGLSIPDDETPIKSKKDMEVV
jgi:hypothetical protein